MCGQNSKWYQSVSYIFSTEVSTGVFGDDLEEAERVVRVTGADFEAGLVFLTAVVAVFATESTALLAVSSAFFSAAAIFFFALIVSFFTFLVGLAVFFSALCISFASFFASLSADFSMDFFIFFDAVPASLSLFSIESTISEASDFCLVLRVLLAIRLVGKIYK